MLKAGFAVGLAALSRGDAALVRNCLPVHMLVARAPVEKQRPCRTPDRFNIENLDTK